MTEKSIIERIGFTHKEMFAIVSMLILLGGSIVLPQEAWDSWFGVGERITRDVIREEIEEYLDLGLGGSPWQTEKPYTYGIGIVVIGGTDYVYCLNGSSGRLWYFTLDASRAINYAIGNASAIGGGRVHIRKADYNLTAWDQVTYGNVAIVPRSNVYLKVEEGTVFNQSHPGDPYINPNDLITMVCYWTSPAYDDAQLHDFTIDGGIWDANHGNWTNQFGVGDPGVYWNMHGFHIYGNDTHPAYELLFKNLEIRHVAGKGVNFFKCHRSDVFNVRFYMAGKNTMVIEGYTDALNWDTKWSTVAYCEFEMGGDMDGAGVAGLGPWHAQNILVFGNKFGPAVTSTGKLFLADGTSKNVFLTNNWFNGSGRIEVHSVSYGEILFDGNYINSLSNGIWLYNSSQWVNNHIIDTEMKVNGGANAHIEIANNHFNGSLITIETPLKSGLITGNYFEEHSRYIELKNGNTNIEISHNVFGDPIGAGTAILSFAAGDFTNIKIYYNDFRAVGTPIGANVLGFTTDLAIKGNDGFNPFGIVANAFDTPNTYIETTGAAATPAASTDYVVKGIDITISSTNSGNTDCAIMIKDPSGNSVLQAALSTLEYMYVPRDYIINWGAFTGAAPTVIVTFN